MRTTERNLVILNSIIISILIVMRLMVFGFILLAFGPFVILPVIVLHTIASTKGFINYSKLADKEKFTLIISFFLFVVFILFQCEVDDMSGYTIIEAFIRRFSKESNQSQMYYSNISLYISIITGTLIIIVDIYILKRTKRLNKKSGVDRNQKEGSEMI